MSIQRVSSYPPSFRWKYDIFLSFRGEDTRKNFTGHLYDALDRKGFKVFRDDKELERGKSISPELFKAIEESRSSIIVFSRNYAYSTWCLDELVKIVQLKKANDQQMVFPIFYDVEPTVVRKQTGNFGNAFTKHEEDFRENIKKVEEWRTTLKEVASLSGWDLKDGNEAEFIQKIVDYISRVLRPTTTMTLDDLVGINSRLEKITLLMDTSSNDKLMIGICGMGGLGKTTLARVVYDSMSSEFEGRSFLANVRENSKKNGLIALQKQLLFEILMEKHVDIYNDFDGIQMIKSKLHCKKVLVVIDDVDDVNQLNKLAGKHSWFGPGSRIIITTRDEHLLTTHRMDQVYKAEALNGDESLELFGMKAFDRNQNSEDYMQLTKCFLQYAGGLPLALEVLSKFLFGRPADEWRSAMERLKRYSENNILDVLQISFDGLQEIDKKIFLDISCFFKGKQRDYVTKILEGCGFDPGIGIGVLIEKHLITISDCNVLWMHDLLQEMGQQIVKRESPEPGKRSRLWDAADVHHMLSKNTGTEAVEGIVLDFPIDDQVHFNTRAKAFSKMTNLRLLKINNMQLPEGLDYISNELRLLEWHGYPSKFLPSNLQLDKTVELNMCYSHIKQLWNGMKLLNKLKFMIFNHSLNLIKTPDFTGAPNLENLILEGCTELYDIHQSLLVHKKLIVLNLKNCTSLKTLPSKINMKSLKKLLLSGCKKLEKFPEIVGSMECLSELHLERTAIKELPLSVEHLTGLVLLNLKDCKNLKCLPSRIINGLKCLQALVLSGCSKLKMFPEIGKSMESLSDLSLDGTAITEVPPSVELFTGLVKLNLKNCKYLVRLPTTVNGLESLKTLNLSGCSKLDNVPENLGKVESLEELDVSGTAIRQPVSSIFLMKNLKTLSFRGCNGPPSSTSWYLPFPMNMMQRRSSDPMALMLPSLSGLCSLTKLDLGDCNLGEGAILNDICNLFSLKELDLSRNNFVSLPRTINRLSKLRDIKLEDCKRLQSLPELPSNIVGIRVDGCASLETLSDALKLCESEYSFINCINCLEVNDYNKFALSMLMRWFLKVDLKPKGKLSFVFPGSRIPEWFRYQNKGSSIKIKRPPNFYNNRKLVGYAVCSVLVVHKYPATIIRTHPVLLCRINPDGKHSPRADITSFTEQFSQALSDHLWLLYLHRQNHIDRSLQENFGLEILNEYSDIEFSFETDEAPAVEVKSCGVHPVYEQEEEHLNQTTNQRSSSAFFNLNESQPNFVGSTTDVSTTSKRSLTDYVAAIASKSGWFDREPQPKRFREL